MGHPDCSIYVLFGRSANPGFEQTLASATLKATAMGAAQAESR